MAYLDDIYSILQVAPTGVPTYVRLSQNENGRRMIFSVVNGEIPAGCTATISGTKPDGVVYSAECSIDDSTVTVDETIQLTAAAGEWDAKIRITNGGNVIATGRVRFVIDADTVDPGSVPSDSELEGLVAEAAGWAEQARSAAYGSPLTASTVAGMTDKTRVYVYTGSESGYTSGNWYYWDGSAWTSGGVYNSAAVQTDTTLEVAGMPADAKATGDAISGLKADISEIATISESASVNKYNKDNVESGYWSTTDGTTLVSNGNYSAGKTFVPVSGGATYNLYWVNNGTVESTSWHYVAWYDEDKNFISGSAVSTSSVTAPNNAAYVRFSVQTTKKNTFMAVDSGTTPTAYIPYAVNSSVAINDDVKIPSVLSGVKVDIIGDSWSAVNDTADTKYTDLLVSKDKIDLNVLAYSGSGYHKPTSSNKPFYTQALSVRATADIVFIFGSFNDVSDIIGGTEIGDVTDSGTTTICGCINTTIDNILSVNPSAKILVATPGAWSGYNANNDGNNANNPTALAYVEAIKNVCFKRGYECKDMLRCMNLKPWINSFKTAYQPDGTHPNNAGHLKYVYPVIKNYLSTVV